MSKEDIRKRNEDKFWEKMKNYPYDYDFSRIKYVNANEKVEIVCQKHGSFFVSPKHLINDHTGCPKCRDDKFRNSKDEFVERVNHIFNNKYDLSKFVYENNKTESVVICTEHGSFLKNPHSLYQGKGCPKCGRIKRDKNEMISKDVWIERFKKVHSDKYDYSKMVYKGYKEKIEIICPEHGSFWQTPDNHYRGKGCPICSSSKMENEVRTFLNNNKIEFEEQKRFTWLGIQSLDFYLPQHNLAIECQGVQHFNNIPFFDKNINLDSRIVLDCNKNKKCAENGINIIYVINIEDLKNAFDSKFKNIYNKNFVIRENLEHIKTFLK